MKCSRFIIILASVYPKITFTNCFLYLSKLKYFVKAKYDWPLFLDIITEDSATYYLAFLKSEEDDRLRYHLLPLPPSPKKQNCTCDLLLLMLLYLLLSLLFLIIFMFSAWLCFIFHYVCIRWPLIFH